MIPSLYAWLWLPLQSRGWVRDSRSTAPGWSARYWASSSSPTGSRSRSEARALYLVGLVTVGYVPLGTVLLAVAWLGAAAQLGALAFGRYAPYAGGAERPPEGSSRGSVATVARRERARRYARAR